jgi:hypothetical protein
MKVVPVAVLSLLTGAIGGYFGFPLLHGGTGEATPAACERGPVSEVLACTLSPEQIEHLSARIAPAVVERLAGSGLPGLQPDVKVAEQLRAERQQSLEEQVEAFSQAARLVDQMIAKREISMQGRDRAHRLLRQSGQADRIYELEARISAAINRGDLTPSQAGLGPPAE